MEWLNDSTTWSLLAPSVAQYYRVLPLQQEGNRLVLLTGKELSEEDLRKEENLLSFHVGVPVILKSLKSFPELELGGFDELLDQYYGIPFPVMPSRAVSTSLMTVVLIDAVVKQRQESAERLSAEGHHVVQFGDVDSAIEFLEVSNFTPDEVIVAAGMYKNPQLLQRLSAATTAQIVNMQDLLATPGNAQAFPQVVVI